MSAIGDTRRIEAVVADDLATIVVSADGIASLEAQDSAIWQAVTLRENTYRQGRFLMPVRQGLPMSYEVELTHSSTQWGIARWHGDLRLGDWHQWLLTPRDWSMTRPFELEVSVPRSLGAILPFQLLDYQPGTSRFRAYPILPDHGGISVFGEMQVREIGVGRQKLTAVVLGEATQTDGLFRWIETVSEAAISVHGSAPGNASLLVVIPIPFVSGVVPWAHVRRGGGSHIIAYVKEGADETALARDWTLYHEMTHLYHPYLHSGGRWVSEGFASYYQNVYRVRSGVVSADYAWGRLLAGLERGRKENASSGNLPVTMGGRMRTYWTAAAMALEADTRLKAAGEPPLAILMGRFADRHLPVDRAWHPRDYLAALDGNLSEPLLVPLYDDYVRDRFFPESEAADGTWQRIIEFEQFLE